MGPADCPVPENICELAFCAVGNCGTVAIAPDDNARVDEGSDPPCKATKCNGLGASRVVNDDDNVEDDGDPCTVDTCIAGEPVHASRELGATCATGEIPAGKCDAEATCVECLGPEDCTNLEESNECQTRMCVEGACVLDRKPDGFVLPTQDTGDCQRRVCNGDGAVREEIDDADLPVDGNTCTADACNSGVASNADLADGVSCGAAGVCSGGDCVGCNTAADCGTVPNACVSLACQSNTCQVSYLPFGTEVDADPTDCLTITCGNGGQLNNDPNNGESPSTDGNDCTADTCLGGQASYQNKSQNASCSSMGGAFCDGAGSCVECNSPTQCSNPIGDCERRTCNANQCGVGDRPSGQPSTTQSPYDCQIEICDGMGMSTSQPQNTDLPFDGNQCTNDVCSSGMASNPPASAGTSCTQSGNVCDGSGTCIDCLIDTDCPQGYCEQMKCTARRGPGQVCNRGAMCSSGHCTDGVCCTTACSGTCEACISSKTGQTQGKCARITSNTDPDNECKGGDVCISGVCCPPLSVQAEADPPLCPAAQL